MNYLSSDKLRIGRMYRERKLFVKIRSQVLRGCNLLLNAFGSDGKLSGPRTVFSKTEYQMNETEQLQKLGYVR